MKINKKARLRMMSKTLLVGSLTVLMMAVASLVLPIAGGLAVICLLLAISPIRIMRWNIQRIIRSQPNFRQRQYILQRLEMLSYRNDSETPENTGTYQVEDLTSGSTLTISCYADKVLKLIYKISFTDEEFVRAADIGNEYRYLTTQYVLSRQWAAISYGEMINYRRSGSSEYFDSKTSYTTLDVLPDSVIERVEYALTAWQPLSIDT